MANRQITLEGHIGREAATRIVRELLSIASKGDETVHLMIDSGGGEVDAFHRIEGAIRWMATHRLCDMRTIARNAYSAAAFLAAASPRTYLHRGAMLGFHGAEWRASYVRLRKEAALAMGMHLDNANQRIVKKLAPRIARRLHDRLQLLSGHAMTWTGLAEQRSETWEIVAAAIRERLVSRRSVILLDDAVEKLRALRPLLQSPSTLASVGSVNDWIVFKNLLAERLDASKDFSPHSAAELAVDFSLVLGIMRSHCRLSSRPSGSFGRNSVNYGVHCLASMLCDRLLFGENILDCEDAFWLGLVDELVDEESINALVKVGH